MNDTIFLHPLTTAVIAGLLLFGIVSRLAKVSYERIARWYVYLSTFSIVVVMNSMFFPFITGKGFFFRFTTELALIAAFLWWAFEARNGELKNRLREMYRKPIVIAVSLFSLAFLLASLFAFDVSAAFWSNYERGEGGFQMIHYYLLFALVVFFVRTEDEWKSLFRCSLVAAGGMILYGIVANFGTAGFMGAYTGRTMPDGWLHKLFDGRFEGSLGNPAYVAPYLLFAMFFAAYLWVRSKMESTQKNFLYASIIGVFVLFFIMAQTRGAFLGFGAGVLVFLLYLARKGIGSMKKWALATLGVLVVVGGLLYSVRDLPAVKAVPAARLLQIGLTQDTAETRLWAWNEAWQGFKERPILGWGPENFTVLFDKYFDPRFYTPGKASETWFDRAHSIYFDYLSETGILGFLTYLGIFGVIGWEFFVKKSGGPRTAGDVAIRGALLAMPVAYLVESVVIFDVLPVYMSLFLFFAFVNYYFSTEHHG